MAEVNIPSNNVSNRSTDIILPASISGDGRSNVLCEITLKPFLASNKNSIYYGLVNTNGSVSYSLLQNKVGPGKYLISIPSSWFRRNNAAISIQVDTYDKNNNFVSGSFAQTMLLHNTRTYYTNYYNYLSDFIYSLYTSPGETFSINILPPKDNYANGLVYDVYLKYHRDVADDLVGKNLSVGKHNFVCPELAINSSMNIKLHIKDKKTGTVLGVVSHCTTIAKGEFKNPEIIFPSGYTFTLSEGVNVKFKGPSTELNDYMVIYAKRQCDVIKAVSKYTTSDSYFAASQNEFKNDLLQNIFGNTEYYVLKDFDAPNTFITRDTNDPYSFHIKTPATNDYKSFNDFYVMQWFKNVKPNDAIYLYVIGRRKEYYNSIEKPTVKIVNQVTTDNWKCDHCQASNYRYWNISKNWNPYTRLALSGISSTITGYETSLTLRVTMDRQLNYPPSIYITNTTSNDETGAVYLTPISQGPATYFDYVVPIDYVKNQISNGKTYLYFHTHWGKNTDLNTAYYSSAVLNVYIKEDPVSPLIDTTFYRYSDYNYDKITQIPVSSMTPYVVIPPAPRPIELTVDEHTTKSITFAYTNPLYGMQSSTLDEFEELGSINFDVSTGEDFNDLSILNDSDSTLDLNNYETRNETYEKQVILPQSLIEKIKKVPSNDIYVDLNIKSINNKNLNFKPIVGHNIMLQVMLSDGSTRARIVDCNSSAINLKQQQYDIKKSHFNKDSLSHIDFNTAHLLYNIDEYDRGKAFIMTGSTMEIDNDIYVDNLVGLKKLNNRIGRCSLYSATYDISRLALGYNFYDLRLVLENMSASKNLYKAPKIIVKYRDKEIQLNPTNLGEIKPGEDIVYNIPKEVYDARYDEVVTYELSPELPYPQDIPSEITFSSAYIEVIGKDSVEDVVDKFASGFTASLKFYQVKKQMTNSTTYDPVQCIDVILCCYDEQGNLINRTSSKRRDIYNGKSFIYYSDRKWHNLYNDKYRSNIKHKPNYRMTFNLPDKTMKIYAMSFTYSNWHDNPSIYSMGNVISIDSIKQDFKLEFINPKAIIDALDPNITYANVDRNNPTIDLRLNAKQNNIPLLNEIQNKSFDLSNTNFNLSTWLTNPLVYSNNKRYGYEQPVFNSLDLCRENNVINTLEPQYNSIEYYSKWSKLYGSDLVYAPKHEKTNEVINVQSNYTIFEDEGEKYISNNAIPYIEIPANLANFNNSSITIFLDTDFGVNNK